MERDGELVESKDFDKLNPSNPAALSVARFVPMDREGQGYNP